MKLISAANHRFAPFLENFEAQCKEVGYDHQVYDLGDLGRGISLPVDHPRFQRQGFYHTMQPGQGWRSKGLHKPRVIADALQRFSDEDVIGYLDADACPVRRFDELLSIDFDVLVTQRRPGEPGHEVLGPINAGVIFFRPRVLDRIDRWAELTAQLGNDQLALRRWIEQVSLSVATVPCLQYNYYYFPEPPPKDVKIYHFKEDPTVRPWFERFRSGRTSNQAAS